MGALRFCKEDGNLGRARWLRMPFSVVRAMTVHALFGSPCLPGAQRVTVEYVTQFVV